MLSSWGVLWPADGLLVSLCVSYGVVILKKNQVRYGMPVYPRVEYGMVV